MSREDASFCFFLLLLLDPSVLGLCHGLLRLGETSGSGPKTVRATRSVGGEILSIHQLRRQQEGRADVLLILAPLLSGEEPDLPWGRSMSAPVRVGRIALICIRLVLKPPECRSAPGFEQRRGARLVEHRSCLLTPLLDHRAVNCRNLSSSRRHHPARPHLLPTTPARACSLFRPVFLTVERRQCRSRLVLLFQGVVGHLKQCWPRAAAECPSEIPTACPRRNLSFHSEQRQNQHNAERDSVGHASARS